MKDVLRELAAEFHPGDIVHALAAVGAMYVVCAVMSAVLRWAGVA